MTQQLALMSSEPARPRRSGRLDEETKRVGREGLSKARAALADASRRAAEREAERLTRRDQELARRAAAARAVAQRRTGTELVAADAAAPELVVAEGTGSRRTSKGTRSRSSQPQRRAAA